MTYSIKKQDGEFVVVNKKGIIISYCDTREQAEDVALAQKLDEERQEIESAFNKSQEEKSLRAQFLAEFA